MRSLHFMCCYEIALYSVITWCSLLSSVKTESVVESAKAWDIVIALCEVQRANGLEVTHEFQIMTEHGAEKREFKDMNYDYADTLPVKTGTYYPKSRDQCQKPSRHKSIRIVSKTGDINIQTNLNQPFKISNYFIALVEARWRWTIINFVLAFIINWLFFGFIYWGISYSHKDFTEEHMNQNDTDFVPCISNTYGFTSTFLFSIEIHTTVAYGKRAITLECPQTIIAMCVQCMVSSFFQSIMVGILFVKLTRPRSRTQTILFSKHAALSLRNETYCLIFRVGDMRTSRILNIELQAFIIRYNSDSDYLDEARQTELKLEIDECESTFFLWPVTVVHLINRDSPLYGISAADLLCSKIEILVVFEGIIESTGQPVQARSSFTEHDILWGHRFLPMVVYNEDKLMYVVDFSKLSEIEQVDTPLCSAREYDSLLSTIVDTYGLSSDSSSSKHSAICMG